MWEVYLASSVAGVLIIGGIVAHFWKKEDGPLSEVRQPAQRRQTAPAADIEQPVKLTEEEMKAQRVDHILSSIIHKVSSYRCDCSTVYMFLPDRL